MRRISATCCRRSRYRRRWPGPSTGSTLSTSPGWRRENRSPTPGWDGQDTKAVQPGNSGEVASGTAVFAVDNPSYYVHAVPVDPSRGLARVVEAGKTYGPTSGARTL